MLKIYFEEDDYISLTDIARVINPLEPKDVVKNWFRQKNTIEYLGLWEKLYNPDFKGVEFGIIRNSAGNNIFVLSAKHWIERTNAIGITAKEWREQNPELQGNIRDYAQTKQLICLSNLENINSVLINDGIPQN